MATVTRENIALLNDKIIVTVTPDDYQKKVETSLKKYAKNAAIPGFRKGMVPTGLIKKMYGQSVFADEVVKLAEQHLFDYLKNENIKIFAQPLPFETVEKLDMNIDSAKDYNFSFEIGLMPTININPSSYKVVRYNIEVDEKMIDEEIERLRTRHGKMTNPEEVNDADNVLNLIFDETTANGVVIENGVVKATSLLVKYFKEDFRINVLGKKLNETFNLQLSKAFDENELEFMCNDLGLNKNNNADIDKHFRLTITKIGHVTKADLNNDFFVAAFPDEEVNSEAECRATIKAGIANALAAQSRNQLHDQIYHCLLDNTHIDLPASFLKRWLQVSDENQKTTEEVEHEYPSYENQLKWSLIAQQAATDNNVEVLPNELKDFAKQQLFQYMGMGAQATDQPWMEDYANRMMKDKKFVEDSYYKVQTNKMFSVLETQVSVIEEAIDYDSFAQKLHHHHH